MSTRGFGRQRIVVWSIIVVLSHLENVTLRKSAFSTTTLISLDGIMHIIFMYARAHCHYRLHRQSHKETESNTQVCHSPFFRDQRHAGSGEASAEKDIRKKI